MKTFPPLVIMLLGLVAGCAPTSLYVAHDTVLGVNAKVDKGRQEGQLVIGYDRDFATVIPKTVPTDTGRDAMSLVHCSNVRVEGIYLDEYSDFTATGTAAKNVAADEFKVKTATSCRSLTAEEQVEEAG